MAKARANTESNTGSNTGASDAQAVFEIEEGRSAGQLLDRIAAAFPGARRGPAPLRRTWCDTFDRRLVRAGATLGLLGDGGLIWRETAGARPSWVPCERAPRFARELPRGLLREEIARRTDGRRLLAAVTVEGRTRGYDVHDDDEKTVARVTIDERAVADGRRRRELPAVLRVEPVRGYERESARLVEFVRLVLDLPPLDVPEPVEALSALGEVPDADPTKPRVALERSMTAGRATRAVLRGLLDVVEAHVPGVVDDLDTEFLHDLRVAVRQTRSVLGQVRDVLPPDDVEHFAVELRWVGTVTGPVRDLDVFLEEWPELVAPLDEAAREDLAPVVEHIARERRKAHAALVRALGSRRFATLLEEWRAVLEDDEGPGAPRADRPVLEVVSPTIRRAYKRVVRKGRGVDADTPAADVHAVRIAAKKLRYLLANFRALYDPGEIDRCVAALKQLQGTLGRFNDACVFEERLLGLADALGRRRSGAPRTLVAVGRLVARLAGQRDDQRERFASRFERFASDEVRRRFKRLFGSGAR